MKTFKGITSIFMVACMLVSLVAFDPTYAVAETSSVAPATPAEKIDAAIWDTTPDEQGRYLVYISRNAVSDDEIEAEFNKRNEFTLAEYTDETLYRRTVGPSVAVKAGYKYGLFESLSMELGRELYDDNISPFKYELIENYNSFIERHRDVVTELYAEYNNQFVEKSIIDDNDILYEGGFTGSYIMAITKDEIEVLSKDASVNSIQKWETVEFTSNTHSVQSQIGTDASEGTKSSDYNDGQGYRGSGIKIGIIECAKDMGTEIAADDEYAGFYNNSPQLTPIRLDNRLFYVNENGEIATSPSNSDHANLVTSIIVGHNSTLNGVTYEGVVPAATVYQTSFKTGVELLERIEVLVSDYNVTVINLSASTMNHGGSYGTVDQEIDAMTSSLGFVLVVSAGNIDLSNIYGVVESPAKGYNVITVGSTKTKLENGTPITSIFYPISAWHESSYLTNKPDLVAPGEYINCRVSDGTYYASGSSFAAPFVVGVVAQLQQVNETIMYNSMRAKAILLAGTDPSKMVMDGSNDSPAYGMSDDTLIREKTGLGFLNAINSADIAVSGNCAIKLLDLRSLTISGNHTMVENISLAAGQKIRVVLTYNKPDNTPLTAAYANKAGLRLYSGNTLKASSTLQYSNVEVLEYEAESAETLTIKIYVSNYNRQLASSTSYNWMHAVAWRIENVS